MTKICKRELLGLEKQFVMSDQNLDSNIVDQLMADYDIAHDIARCNYMINDMSRLIF